jgi:hypothetical protein
VNSFTRFSGVGQPPRPGVLGLCSDASAEPSSRAGSRSYGAQARSLLRFAHKTSKNRLKRRFFTLQTDRRKPPAETAKKTKFSRSPFIGVFMAFFNEKTIKTYKRNRLLA